MLAEVVPGAQQLTRTDQLAAGGVGDDDITEQQAVQDQQAESDLIAIEGVVRPPGASGDASGL